LLSRRVVEHQRWLVGRHQQPASVGGGVIDELPLVIVVLLIELTNCFVFADTGNAYNASAAKELWGAGWPRLLRERLRGWRSPRLRPRTSLIGLRGVARGSVRAIL